MHRTRSVGYRLVSDGGCLQTSHSFIQSISALIKQRRSEKRGSEDHVTRGLLHKLRPDPTLQLLLAFYLILRGRAGGGSTSTPSDMQAFRLGSRTHPSLQPTVCVTECIGWTIILKAFFLQSLPRKIGRIGKIGKIPRDINLVYPARHSHSHAPIVLVAICFPFLAAT